MRAVYDHIFIWEECDCRVFAELRARHVRKQVYTPPRRDCLIIASAASALTA